MQPPGYLSTLACTITVLATIAGAGNAHENDPPDVQGADSANTAVLLDSIERDDVDAVAALLARGVDVNARTRFGGVCCRTALEIAAAWNRLDIATLLAAGAAVDPPRRGDTPSPLLMAVRSKEEWVALLLIEHDADVNAQTRLGGWTLLHLAAIDRGVAVLATILKAGADVHVRDAGGDTALHVAAEENEGDVVLTLLQVGADPGVENGAGETPWHKARTNMFPYLIEGTPAWCWLREGERCPPPEGK